MRQLRLVFLLVGGCGGRFLSAPFGAYYVRLYAAGRVYNDVKKANKLN